jgi:hypothetical protein
MSARPEDMPQFADRLAARPPGRERTVRPFGEFISADFPVPRWRADGLLPNEGLALVIGAEKEGKSLLVNQMALCIAAGIPFWGRPVEQATVLLIEEEGSEPSMQDRLVKQAHRLGLLARDDLPLHVAVRQRFSLDENGIAEVERWVELVGAQVLMIGPLAQVASITDENKAGEVNALARRLVDLAARQHVLIVLPHHRRKPDKATGQPHTVRDYFNSARGSNALVAGADAALGVAREPDAEIGVLYVLLRDGPAERLHFTFERDSLTTWPTEAPRSPGQKALPEDVVEVVRALGGWVNRNQVAARLAVSPNTARERLEVLAADGRLRRRTGQRGVVEYATPDGTLQIQVDL